MDGHAEEFRIKLKDLCMRYDVENGNQQSVSMAGCAIYKGFCDENGIDPGNYIEERDSTFDTLYKTAKDKWVKNETHLTTVVCKERLDVGDFVTIVGNIKPIGKIVRWLDRDRVIISDRFGQYEIGEWHLYKVKYIRH